MRKLPDIYIIGTQKSGTTTLYDWLAQHPQIYGHPLAKDYPYFSNTSVFNEGAIRFFSFFRNAPREKRILGGEANAMYAPLALQRMHQLMPDAKLITLLRDPVERAYSGFAYAVERLMENRSFEQAIRDEMEGKIYVHEDALQRDYLGHGRYAEQLERVYSYFHRDQVKVVIFEEFKASPQTVLADIFRFFDIDDAFVPDMTISNETKGGLRYKWLASLTYGAPKSKALREIVRAVTPFSMRSMLRSKLEKWNRIPSPKPVFTLEARRLLTEYYADKNAKLELLLGKKIPQWTTQ